MKAGILFTASGPILVLTSYDSLVNPSLVQKLRAKGIRKYIAFDIPENEIRETYGTHFEATLDDLKQSDDLRVLDEDGHHILNHVSLRELKQPQASES